MSFREWNPGFETKTAVFVDQRPVIMLKVHVLLNPVQLAKETKNLPLSLVQGQIIDNNILLLKHPPVQNETNDLGSE